MLSIPQERKPEKRKQIWKASAILLQIEIRSKPTPGLWLLAMATAKRSGVTIIEEKAPVLYSGYLKSQALLRLIAMASTSTAHFITWANFKILMSRSHGKPDTSDSLGGGPTTY